ncbi:MAG: LCP family protein, partial [Clostridia bacterium]|nr:LCP family protein [Clostridia bacterium]
MKRILTFVLLVLLFLPLLSNFVGGEGKDVYTFLLCGYDESADNTDAIILFNYDINSNIATFLQLPRDTVCKYKGEMTALNSIYPKEVLSGETPYRAMENLTEYVEEVLGIKVDGFTGISLEAFRRFVDNLGGVEVNFEEDVYYKDEESGAILEFKKGENHLDGKEA